MIKLTLTRAQIEYLLYLNEYEKYRTITSASLHFSCSKTNSKKILDRMVSIGVLYKDDNDYNLTQIGESFANYYEKKRKDIIYILKRVFSIDENRSKEISIDLLGKGLEDLYDSIERKADFFNILDNKKPIIKTSELLNIFKNKILDLNFNIYKIHEDLKSSFIEKSMAIMGFEENAKLVFNEDPYISLKAKTIEKSNEGYNKKGIATKLFYYKDNKEHEINSIDKEFRIPLNIIDYWNNSGNGILETGLMFRIKSQIGMSLHVKDANFIFTVNLDLI